MILAWLASFKNIWRFVMDDDFNGKFKLERVKEYLRKKRL